MSRNHNAALSAGEKEVFEQLLPDWHRDFLQHKHYPAYAIKTSLARLANRDDDARDLWHDAALGLRDTPSALSIIKLSMLIYPLIDLAIYRRQLCQGIIIEIKRGNLKPYVYPDSLEDRGLSDREKLQAYLRLPLTEQVFAIIELNELGRGLTTTETFQRQAHTLWKRYHDRARLTDEPAPRSISKTPVKEETKQRNEQMKQKARELWAAGKNKRDRKLKTIAVAIDGSMNPGVSVGHISDIISETLKELEKNPVK
ncbi:hypothetical protein [Thiothrix winogradskyi]|uniref:Uncharacterized protein n=1 Tax=Thiothrix winogradskyi TaxID=96472 RepID=A0ABY3SY48_9GAMM|nr:hypothetical protein [Thiothrix winogradskyi]UJS23370.1 hypothetical protein L2Y54_15665 [Thiothrix winogradskyi]